MRNANTLGQTEQLSVGHLRFQEEEVLEFGIKCWSLVRRWEEVCVLAAASFLSFQNEDDLLQKRGLKTSSTEDFYSSSLPTRLPPEAPMWVTRKMPLNVPRIPGEGITAPGRSTEVRKDSLRRILSSHRTLCIAPLLSPGTPGGERHHPLGRRQSECWLHREPQSQPFSHRADYCPVIHQSHFWVYPYLKETECYFKETSAPLCSLWHYSQ